MKESSQALDFSSQATLSRRLADMVSKIMRKRHHALSHETTAGPSLYTVNTTSRSVFASARSVKCAIADMSHFLGDLRQSKDDEFDCCGGNITGFGRIADGVEQCLHAAREEIRQGADFIKIMVSGGKLRNSRRRDQVHAISSSLPARSLSRSSSKQMHRLCHDAHFAPSSWLEHATSSNLAILFSSTSKTYPR